MSNWSKKPFIYEINTSVWLNMLSQQYNHTITLHNVPDEVINNLAGLNIDVIWLMGIWQRSEAARKSALNYVHEYESALPDITHDDVIGSAYAIGSYKVDAAYGGRDALANFRQRLNKRGLKLILDFVPNHVATDHVWIREKPHYMVRGTRRNYHNAPDLFFKIITDRQQELIIAHGRDPYFPGWIDTAQLNAFSTHLRDAIKETLIDIASQCDGVRCDMAMLMVNEIFEKTWGPYLQESAPDTEYWEDIIPTIKEHYPDFKFIAEVYWDMEYSLLLQGFDWTYDKRLYDRIQGGRIEEVIEHLQAPLWFQQQQIRFIENHDEARAAASLGFEKGRVAAVLISTLPGGVLLHDGQLEGRTVKLPVQIGRQPDENLNYALRGFYHKLLQETRSSIYTYGEWRLLNIKPPYQGNYTNMHLIAYSWQHHEAYRDGEYRVIVTNLTSRWSQGVIPLQDWPDLRHNQWRLFDILGRVCTYRDGNDILENGLYIELEPYQSQIFRFERLDQYYDADLIRRLNGMMA